MKRFFVLLLTALTVSCTSLREMDPSFLNHKAMDLSQEPTQEALPLFTGLGNATDGSSGGGCGACAN